MDWWERKNEEAKPLWTREQRIARITKLLDEAAELISAGVDPAFLAEEFWQKAAKSLERHPEPVATATFEQLEREWEEVINGREEIREALEPWRKRPV